MVDSKLYMVDCGVCGGTGRSATLPRTVCPTCKGSGREGEVIVRGQSTSTTVHAENPVERRKGKIIRTNWFDKALCKKHPNDLFVFGDNLRHKGKLGQAVIRDEPNAVGIPTKREPNWRYEAYFYDKDLEEMKPIWDEIFKELIDHLELGGNVWISDDIGDGLAELPKRSPTLYV